MKLFWLTLGIMFLLWSFFGVPEEQRYCTIMMMLCFVMGRLESSK